MGKIIIEDERDIKRIEIFTQQAMDIESYSAKEGFKIIAYHENGDMAPVVWFAIYRYDEIVARVNGKYVQLIDY